VPRSGFAGFRFPPDVIMVAVRWYLRYGLSYRDVEELLAERGIEVDHVTVYRWVQRFTPLLIDAARPCRHAPGDHWFVDETYVKVARRWVYLYRAIDQFGQVIDVPHYGAVRQLTGNKPESLLPSSARSLIEALGVEATALVPRPEGGHERSTRRSIVKRQGSPGGVHVALEWSVGADRVPVALRFEA